MELKRKGKGRRGFTLTEVLVVVAIVALVLAIGVPAIIGSVRRANLKKLDDSARSIFLAAQNSLTAMVGNGEIKDFAEGLDNEVKPSDFPASGHGEIDDIRYLDSTDPDHEEYLKKLVPGGSIDKELENGRYIVEYNRATGAVYAVWYSDEEEFVKQDDFTHEPRAFDERLKEDKYDYPIGYYGGTGVDYALVGQMPIPELTVLNGEELILRIKMPSSDSGALYGKIGLEITMTGAKSGIEKIILGDRTGLTQEVRLNIDKTADLVLDTLKGYSIPDDMYAGANNWVYGKAFKEWDTGFTPGENITVTVTTYYAGSDDALYLSQSASVTTNSLFASVEGTTAKIAYGRHLQNLDAVTSGVKENITAAEQVQAIDFSKDWKTTYTTTDGTGADVVLNFTPIENDNLTKYDGKSLPIKHLTAKQDVPGGMFETMNNTTLTHIVLVDTNCTYGALAATLSNGEINSCQVYLVENTKPYDASHTTPEIMITGMNGPVGGLVGTANGCMFRSCFASTAIQATGTTNVVAGGLVGVATGLTGIQDSYAASYIESTGIAGGLIGESGSNTIIGNVYAAGIIASANTSAGGLIAHATSGASISNSYAAVRYSDTVAAASKDTSATVTIYGAAPELTDTPTNVYYVRQAGVKYADNSGTSVSTKQLSEMKSGTSGTLTLTGDWYKPTEPADNPTNPSYATFPYKQTPETADLTTPYPYPMLNSGDMPMLHYGDWLEQDIYGYMFYWEKEGSDYHFYTRVPAGAGGTTPVSDLHTEHHDEETNTNWSITEWGYALVGLDLELPTGLTGDTLTNAGEIKTALEKFVTDTKKDELKDTALSDLLKDADTLTFFEGKKYNRSDNRFFTIETDDGWLEFNLKFAAAVDIVVATDKPIAPTHMGKKLNNTTGGFPYQIRTVMQLDNIVPDNGHYEQTHDLDGTGYGEFTRADSVDFTGTYDGGSYRILELNITNSGLFYRLEDGAELKNIILYSPTGKATIKNTSRNYLGGLTQMVWGKVTIDNCVVAGYTIESTGSYIGGLVGKVWQGGQLEMKDCATVNTLNVKSSNNYIGGLVGSVATNPGTTTWAKFENCYAGGDIAGSVNSTANIGGLVGYLGTSVQYCTYNNVYSYVNMCDVTGVTNVYGIGPGKAQTTSGTAYTNCTYWKGGLGDHAATEADTLAKPTSLDDLKVTIPNAQHTYRPGLSLAEGLTECEGDDIYPFKAVVPGPNDELVHYGDWPEEVEASSLCYYEQYTDGYGLWGYIADTPTATAERVNTLRQGKPGEGPFAVADGYCVPVKHDTDVPGYILIDGEEVQLDTTPIATVTITGRDGTYDLYEVKPDNEMMGIEGAYYTSVKLGENKTQYWFNPAFACEIIQATDAPTDPIEKLGTGGLAPAGTSTDYSDVIIRTARQLANLAKATGDQYTSYAAQKRHYVQLLDIRYDKYTGAGLTVGKTSMPVQTPAALNDGGSYDGNKFIISKLYIGNGEKGTGLFGRSKGSLSHIRLLDVNVDGGSKENTGALVGSFEGDGITDCGVYVSSAENYGTFRVYSNNSSAVGGLIGNYKTNEGASLDSCFAAVQVTGRSQVGGLIGKVSIDDSDCTITNCYAGGHTISGAYSDANVNVSGVKSVGGFIGYVESDDGETFKLNLTGTNYTTCSIGIEPDSDSTYGVFIGGAKDISRVNVKSDSIAYALGKVFKTGSKDGILMTESYLTTPPTATTTVKAITYDSTLGDTYPYQSGQTEHYGDWEQKVQVTGYIYWELEGSTYNYSVTAFKKEAGDPDWKELTTIDPTLCNEYDTTGISNYGYGWFYAGDFDSAPNMTDATGGTSNTDAANKLADSLKTALETALSGVDLDTVTVEAYSYNNATPVGGTQTWSIQQGAETLQTATLNPDFADTINRDASTPYKVRTIRQLQHINNAAYLAQTFEQGHDLDGKDVTYTPIGNGTANGFTGNYDGKGYRIRHLNIEVEGNVANAGLFGRVSGDGEFKNIIMWGENNTISANGLGENSISSGYARIGGIIAEVSSGNVTISNCVVAGYTLTGVADGCDNVSYHNYVIEGGIVGSLRGSVVNCEAVVNIEAKAGGSTGIWGRRRIVASVGGLVGEINSGRVENSYAGGRITALDNDLANLTDSNIGGLVGDSNSNTVDHCFSYVSYVGDSNRYYYIDGRGSNHESCAYLGANNTRNNRAHQCANFTDLSSWFTDNAAFFHTPSQINGEAVTNPTFNGAVVQVPINSDGTHAYVHYGDLPTGAEVAGDPGIEGPEIMAALPPDPPEEVPDPTPTEPDPGSGGKEEKPE